MTRSGRWEMLKIIAHLTTILLSLGTWRTTESRFVADVLGLRHVYPGMHPDAIVLSPHDTTVGDVEDDVGDSFIPITGEKINFAFMDRFIEPEDNKANRNKRNIDEKDGGTNSLSAQANERTGTTDGEQLRIEGFRIEQSEEAHEMIENGVSSVRANTPVTARLFGTGITPDTVIIFTNEPSRYRGSCQVPVTEKFQVMDVEDNGRSALVEFQLPELAKNKKFFYICAKYESTDPLEGSEEKEKEATRDTPFLHQGVDSWMRLTSSKPLFPLWASIIIICFCLVFSALFSGLNLGLMSLDQTDLQILCNTGSDKEKHYAHAIKPVRDKGNYLLCSILLGNVLVNSSFTILLDGLTSGLFAIIGSTIAIVIFGEIIPQAICSRHGLAVGARTIMITKAVMLITFPLSYPISKVLDFLLGKEIGNFYDRERLKELVKVTNDVNDLDKDEVNVIAGVLELRKKTVQQVMTRLQDAYMLPIDGILDFEKIAEIMESGFSRIPVFEGENREEIISILHSKDLAFIDPDDNTPVRLMCEFYVNKLHFVFFDQTLDVMFKEFKTGAFGHMAFVHRVNADGDGDPFYETLGLITMEDVLEELIQAEIIDETDVYTDNRSKIPRKRIKRADIPSFVHRSVDTDAPRLRIAPQLMFATYQYISAAVPAFKSNAISETILRRLLNQNIYHQIKIKSKDRKDRVDIISYGTPIDYFVLILEGRVEVTVGKENLLFESGPFTHFGLQAIVQNTSNEQPISTSQQILGSLTSINREENTRNHFIPDYTVKAISDVLYMQISRSSYLAAMRATLMERSQKLGDQSMDTMDAEVEQLMNSLDKGDQNSLTPDATNLTVNSGAQASNSPSDVASPTTGLHDPTNNTNFSVARNHAVLVHDHSSSAAAANEINIGASTSYRNDTGTGAGKSETDPSSVPLLPKP
uniref:CNNM transmembrane domain-containing protein n=1 Tax=Anopheles minimus TaxID=112268 RepID=A0A182VRG0_9DIPT